jgi:hypothetical protein
MKKIISLFIAFNCLTAFASDRTEDCQIQARLIEVIAQVRDQNTPLDFFFTKRTKPGVQETSDDVALFEMQKTLARWAYANPLSTPTQLRSEIFGMCMPAQKTKVKK